MKIIKKSEKDKNPTKKCNGDDCLMCKLDRVTKLVEDMANKVVERNQEDGRRQHKTSQTRS